MRGVQLPMGRSDDADWPDQIVKLATFLFYWRARVRREP